MFLPKSQAETSAEAKAKAERNKAYDRIEKWSVEAIPSEIREGAQINVQEVQCGDPNCAPVDTAIAIVFQSGGRGMLGLPMEAKDVTKELLLDSYPTEEVLRAWSRGEDAEWPPFEDEEYDDDEFKLPVLRFQIGQRVECRVGPDPVTGWTTGEIIQLWYREPNWPEDSWAPYKVQLDDGRKIFAPGDVDQVIRAERRA
mmetsp:Transcript_8263/g.11373  ORF Transcript_8263/g.11373 Transcript_8263/m.11373 type:complete len:199 (-) Transcript_8263:883-1479(-)|eukprot:CAMPEP_0185725416 /NCGR_PEP_ID=MMETSP1171-20130828/1686_1 /TAXON_ID=374046 /ORGANISM="Helicotheca tamensis, Strain CCMP826" /LENGTH=198 /DNA_ID=CAMNT_0028393545 /DNA_START=148 /DNA_END=744 /DNA_ORIENTATION=+